MARFGWMYLVVGLFLSSTAFAKKGDPVPVVVRVVDPDGNPVANAIIRHPEEKARHTVNVETGEWEESRLYLESGKEIVFGPDMPLELEVSAVGFVNQNVRYLIRKRKNLVLVVLQPMSVDMDIEASDVNVQFKRDRPIE